ncbi:MAG: hypothetical protein ACLQT6_17215 [Desulfomonilaceae bacterium]
MNTSIGTVFITIAAILSCSLFTAPDPVEAVDQGMYKRGSESLKEKMIAAKLMAQTGSRKMMDGAKMLQESMKIMKLGNDRARATAMMNNAIQIIAEGEKMVAEAQEMAKKSPSIKAQMKPILSSCIKMMGGCNLMREGAGMMAEDGRNRSWAEETVAKGHKRAKEAAKKIELGGSKEPTR